jgi:outer membrane protein assembly factor BamB
MLRCCLVSSFVLVLSLSLAGGADWPRFRGPNGTGAVDGPLPDMDPAKPMWKTKLPGKGAGSPIIVGGKVYLQAASADGKTRTLVCVTAATGKIEWERDLVGEKAHTHAKNSLASGTPASDGTHIYCQWWDGSGVSLVAHDLTGKEVWRASLGGYKSQHGPGFSPMLHDGLVFVNVDDDQRAELVAFDAKTGERKWIAPRKHVRACYSTPFVLERPGKPAELILGTTTAITSYDPKTGKVNWEHVVAWPKEGMPLRVIGHPVYAAGLIVLYSGDGSGARYMAAIDPDKKAPAKVWELRRDTPYVPCVLVKGDKLFWIGDKGVATCAEAKTGKAVWAERVFEKSDVSASPVMVGDQIVMVSEAGEIAVVKADKEFAEPTKVALKERVFASPAVADGKVFVRGDTHLFCFGK